MLILRKVGKFLLMQAFVYGLKVNACGRFDVDPLVSLLHCFQFSSPSQSTQGKPFRSETYLKFYFEDFYIFNIPYDIQYFSILLSHFDCNKSDNFQQCKIMLYFIIKSSNFIKIGFYYYCCYYYSDSTWGRKLKLKAPYCCF